MKLARTLAVCCALALLLAAAPALGPVLPAGQALAATTYPPRAYLPFLRAAPNPVPAAPALSAINNGGAASYRVSWSTVAQASGYVLQEDDNSGFAHPTAVYSGGATQWQCTGRAPGTYYYRVQAMNSAGSSGWSATRSATVAASSSITPNDPSYSKQWALPKVGAPAAWPSSQGDGVIIAVVDTGVDLKHPDLAGKVLAGRHFYTDSGNTARQDTNVQDDNGHGTHCSGIAAAIGNNGTGVAGLAWKAQILPVKVLDSSGSGYNSDIAAGITWAVDHGARIISLSLGGAYSSGVLTSATDYAYSHGSLVVAAAGNCGDGNYAANGCPVQNPTIYPAANANVLGIAATDSNDARASFSETGSFVDLSAPGVQIYSTLWSKSGSTYGYESGTSMATPLVSGLAALVWSRNPSLTNAQVVSVLESTTTHLGASGRNDQYGYGRINASAAVAGAASGQLAGAPAGQEPGVTVASAQAAGAAALQAAATGRLAVRPGIILVRMKASADVSQAVASQVLQAYGAQAAGEVAGLGIQLLRVTPGAERQAAATLLANPNVEFAEPDYVMSAMR
jgi:subtilisin family serine protease